MYDIFYAWKDVSTKHKYFLAAKIRERQTARQLETRKQELRDLFPVSGTKMISFFFFIV